MKHFFALIVWVIILPIALFAQAPVADFSPGTQQVGTVPFVVTFTDLSTNSPTDWVWHFGDGAVATVQNPSHTYNQTGIYTVSLQASNVGGSDMEAKQALVWAKAVRVINLPEIVELNVTPGSENARTTRVYGDDGYDVSGHSVSSGDVNGDGYIDVIIGAYRADPAGGTDAGETYVIYGSSVMESVTGIDLDGTPSNVTRIYGDDVDDGMGWSVSSGDINGDGYTDVIIGAYQADPVGGSNAGETYIIYGSSGMESIASIDLDGTPSNVTRIYGDDEGTVSGHSVSSGDINGDGYTDVIIGAWWANPDNRWGAGETYIIYGSAGMESITGIDLNGTPANVTRIYGDDVFDYSGTSVSSGDINGDGYTDVIIGAYMADPVGGTDAGETYVIYGSSVMESVTGIDLDGTPSNVTRIYGDDVDDRLGQSVSSGDINGDGYTDVIIGAQQADPVGGSNAGETYIIYGSSGMESIASIDLDGTPSNVTRIYGDDSQDRSGHSVSSGDINGDGYTDVIIGAYVADPAGGTQAGETYIIYGSTGIESIASIDLDGTPSNVTRIYGDDAYDLSGGSVSSGDINGDGYTDVIIGAKNAYAAGGTEAGETYIIYSSEFDPPSAPQNLIAIAFESVKLIWDANSESDLWYYTVYRNTTYASNTADSIASVLKPDSTYTDTIVNIGITYYYWTTAVDSLGNESDFSIGVSAIPNNLPVWVDIPDTSFVEDDSLNLNLDDWISDQNDPDSTLTITVSGGSKISAFIDSITHIIKFETDPDSSGFSEQFILTATDPYGLSAEDTIFVTVLPVNDAPTITSADSVVAVEDEYFAYHVTTIDIDNTEMSWSFDLLPIWLTADADSVLGIPLNGDVDTLFMAIVSDGQLSDSMIVIVDVIPVNDPPENFTTIYPTHIDTFSTHVDNDSIITFTWTPSIDVDSEVLYKLRLELEFFNQIYSSEYDEIADTTFGISSYSLDALLSGLNLDIYELSWFVYVTDEEYTIISDTNTFILMRDILWLDESLLIPEIFALHQNYPNPFNPITTIRYDLPEQSKVNITIYDLLGRQVKTLTNQTQEAGYRSITWDASNVSSGMYLYQIKVYDPDAIGAGNYTQTRKMVILK